MKILYLGDLWPGSTALQRARALQGLGHSLVLVDTTQPHDGLAGYGHRILQRVGCFCDFRGANRTARRRVKHVRPDLIWVDKGLSVSPRILRFARRAQPAVLMVGYSPDDMAAPHNQSRRYRAALKLYDLHVTTKSYNVAELAELGARRVLFVGNGFDPELHRPLCLSPVDGDRYAADITFVGSFEEERACQVEKLAKRGLQVTVWGTGWRKSSARHANLDIKYRPVVGEEYVKVLNATKVNLCFLRKMNRDLQTQRSVEIPACRAFMLAERTSEHLSLFEEGVEAEFFADIDELESKCRFYLANPVERLRIAENGYRRCFSGGYTYQARLAQVFKALP